jgi:hypothetical protein
MTLTKKSEVFYKEKRAMTRGRAESPFRFGGQGQQTWFSNWDTRVMLTNRIVWLRINIT